METLGRRSEARAESRMAQGSVRGRSARRRGRNARSSMVSIAAAARRSTRPSQSSRIRSWESTARSTRPSTTSAGIVSNAGAIHARIMALAGELRILGIEHKISKPSSGRGAARGVAKDHGPRPNRRAAPPLGRMARPRSSGRRLAQTATMSFEPACDANMRAGRSRNPQKGRARCDPSSKTIAATLAAINAPPTEAQRCRYRRLQRPRRQFNEQRESRLHHWPAHFPQCRRGRNLHLPFGFAFGVFAFAITLRRRRPDSPDRPTRDRAPRARHAIARFHEPHLGS